MQCCVTTIPAFVLPGTQQYSKYTGYAQTYQWSGSYQDTTPRYLLDPDALTTLNCLNNNVFYAFVTIATVSYGRAISVSSWSKDLNNLMATTRFSTDLMIPRGLILLTFTSSNTTMRLTFGGLNEILQLSEGLALNLGHNFHLLYFTQPLSDVDVAARNYCCITILCIFFVCVFFQRWVAEKMHRNCGY